MTRRKAALATGIASGWAALILAASPWPWAALIAVALWLASFMAWRRS